MTRCRTSAVRRAAVDNDATIGSVTYENFVQDLDPGDSFAATMIDIMVKELAERRNRPQTDRRCLSTRTLKSLRQLATPFSQFHPHRIRTRRLNSVMLPEMDDLDEDNFEFMLGEATEGVHMSSADLYDAMSIPWPRRGEDPSSSVRTTVTPSGVRSPPASNRGPWTVLPAPSSVPVTLTRQASVRRPFNNSRNIEFNNFTRRHRLAHREGVEGEGVTVENMTEPREDPWTTRTTSSARRFFPPVAARRLRRTTERAGLSRGAVDIISDGTSSGDEDSLNTLTGETQLHASYIALPHNFSGFDPSVPPIVPSMGPGGSGDEQLTLPRLRRGGVFAPELISSPQNAIPSTSEAAATPPPPPPPVAAAAPEEPPTEASASTSATSAPQNAVVEEVLFHGEPPAAYPTPGSSEGEHLG
ncbi:hypothetical protein MD484_g2935, partial [Candolleomyces efflorescens]